MTTTITHANGGTMTDLQVFEHEMQVGTSFHNADYVLMWHYTFGMLHALAGPVNSLCDLGAGVGVWPTVAKNAGVSRVTAYDLNPFHREYFRQHGNPAVRYILDDFLMGIEGAYDVVSSIEVFEHIPDERLLPFVAMLAGHCRWFLFSSCPMPDPDFDTRWGHINIKPTAEWKAIFESNGFQLHATMGLPTTWTMLFKSTRYEK